MGFLLISCKHTDQIVQVVDKMLETRYILETFYSPWAYLWENIGDFVMLINELKGLRFTKEI